MPIKVKDLMIGDWFHNNYTNENYQLWPTFFSQATRHGQQPNATLEDLNCKPIPLTDKILEKNGFEYHHKNFAALTYDHPFQLEMEQWPDKNGIALWSVNGIIKIRYVHELQHALRMCDVDVDIKLED